MTAPNSANPLFSRDFVQLESVLDRFDEAWQAGIPRIEDFLPAPNSAAPATRRTLLTELIKLDLECRWRFKPRGGNPLALADYVAKFPELGPLDQMSLDLIGEEYRVRRRWGDCPGHEEYRTRFPRQRNQLGPLLILIDAQLAAESGPRSADRDKDVAEQLATPFAAVPLAVPVSPSLTADQFRQTLAQTGLLDGAQLQALLAKTGRSQNVRELGRELIARGWLTVFQVNQLLAGRGHELFVGSYVLLERLGEGGTGQVFKVRHTRMGRVVALKIIRKDLVDDPDVVARFYREIRLIAQLTNPHVVHALDAGPMGPVHVLIMEYVDGIDFSQLVKKSGPLPVNLACEYIRQASLGLHHIHEHGLVHRDVKPSNLMLTGARNQEPGVRGQKPATPPGVKPPASWSLGPDSCVKILDLGLARLQRPMEKEWTQTLTPQHGLILGTPDYLAPEQAMDSAQVDIRADIYGLGCTFWYMLTGQPLFPGGSLAQKWLRHQMTEPPPLRGLRADVPDGVEAIVRQMLAKRREDRFQSPGALATVLEALLEVPPGAGTATAGTPSASSAAAIPTTREVPDLQIKQSVAVNPAPVAVAVAPVAQLAPAGQLVPAGQMLPVAQLVPPSGRPGWKDRRRFLLLASVLVLVSLGIFLILRPAGASRSTTTRQSQAATQVAPMPDTGPVKVASYRASFQGPQPAAGWRYLWNKTGPVGNPSHYAPLLWDGTKGYNTDGGQALPRPDPGASLNFHRDGGHPGLRAQGTTKWDFYAVAAYTLQDKDGAGFYRLVDSSIDAADNMTVLVRVNRSPPLLTRPIRVDQRPPTSFDTDLGRLRPDDTVYVAVGANQDNRAAGFNGIDFAIQRGGEALSNRGVLLQDGFEELLPAWSMNPGPAPFRLDDKPRQGQKCLRITNSTTGSPAYQAITRCVDENPVPGAVYRAVCWVRGRGLGGGGGVTSYFQFMETGQVQLHLVGSKQLQEDAPGSWVQLTVEGTAPPQTRRVVFGLVMHSRGTTWFDDLEVTRELPTRP